MLFEHWKSLCPAPGTPPPRAAFDPVDVPAAISTLVLVEVVGGDMHYRLVGTDQVAAWGHDYTGRMLSEIMSGSYHDFIRSLFEQAIETRACVFSHSRFQWDRGRSVDTKRLMMPFTDNEDPATVRFVLESQVFDFGRTGPEEPLVAAPEEMERVELERAVMDGDGGRR